MDKSKNKVMDAPLESTRPPSVRRHAPGWGIMSEGFKGRAIRHQYSLSITVLAKVRVLVKAVPTHAKSYF